MNSLNVSNSYYNKNINTSFKGMSNAKLYESAFDYMAASIIDSNKKLSGTLVEISGGKPLGASQIKSTVDLFFEKNLVFNQPPIIDMSRTKFAKGACIKLKKEIKRVIDATRKNAMSVWREIITKNPKKLYSGLTKLVNGIEKDTFIYNGLRKGEDYFDKVKKNPILQFIIWHSFMSDLSERNRHIPPPVNPVVMEKTVQYFSNVPKQNYASKLSGNSKFYEKYLDELVNNAVDNIFENKNNEYSKIKVFDNTGKEIPAQARKTFDYKSLDGLWVELPKRHNDGKHSDRNVLMLEQLSHPNWCTKSRSDMAGVYLRGRKFLVYLKRDNKNDTWKPELGILVLSDKNKNQIERIQGTKNDNIVPEEHKARILEFMKKNNYACLSRKADEEGMFASEQMGII